MHMIFKFYVMFTGIKYRRLATYRAWHSINHVRTTRRHFLRAKVYSEGIALKYRILVLENKLLGKNT